MSIKCGSDLAMESSLQENFKLKQCQVDTWTTREHLCLTSVVNQIGDQNWVAVRRALRLITTETNRPPDWYSTKNCALQYAKLLEQIDIPKRKREKGDVNFNETPDEIITKMLSKKRIEELKGILEEERASYEQLRKEIQHLESNQLDNRLNQYWDEIIGEQEKEEEEAKKLQEWLKEREEKMNIFQAASKPQSPKGLPLSFPKRAINESRGTTLTSNCNAINTLPADLPKYKNTEEDMDTEEVLDMTGNSLSSADANSVSLTLNSNTNSTFKFENTPSKSYTIKKIEDQLSEESAAGTAGEEMKMMDTTDDTFASLKSKAIQQNPEISNLTLNDIKVETTIDGNEFLLENNEEAENSRKSNTKINSQGIIELDIKGSTENTEVALGNVQVETNADVEEARPDAKEAEKSKSTTDDDVMVALINMKEEASEELSNEAEGKDSTNIIEDGKSENKKDKISFRSILNSSPLNVFSEKFDRENIDEDKERRDDDERKKGIKKEVKDEYEFEDDVSAESTDVKDFMMSRGERRKFSIGESVSSPVVSESTPSSPASTNYGDDPESEKLHRSWKRSVMLVWNDIAAHKNASIFLRPITEEKVPGYHSIVFKPIDLLSIKRSIENGTIRTSCDFQRDTMLMFLNAKMYNKRDHNVYRMADDMMKDAVETIEEFINAQLLARVMETPQKSLRRETRESSAKRVEEDMKRKREEREEKPVKRRKI